MLCVFAAGVPEKRLRRKAQKGQELSSTEL